MTLVFANFSNAIATQPGITDGQRIPTLQ
jgi:hypothetical protein